jgi:lipopolysaccharide export system protein LptA
VWTPKRVVLLAVGFVMFFSGYAVYANFLGGIDGLPPLPEEYLQRLDDQRGPDEPRKPKSSALQSKLRQAFGAECKEVNCPIKLELHAKRFVLAADTFTIEQDGRVYLQPLSLAQFGAEKGDGRPVEINTLCARQAYLTFDRPVTNLSELSNRKIVAAELFDQIQVRNNHRTPSRDDDLVVDIDHGPLYYDESKHLIWTKDAVLLRDYQSKPKPTEIRGKMMDMELLTEGPPAKPGAPAPKKGRGESISGVKSIVLHSAVEMNLYPDGQSGFPGGMRPQPANSAAAKAPGGAPPEKAHILIKTPGKFRYDVFKDYDVARFDVAERDAGRSPNHVKATRTMESTGTVDQLDCEHLELRLRRREAASKAGADSTPDRNLEIETARATGPDGLVTLTSDVEKLTAHGSDFFYDASKELTILKGQPIMEAERDQNVIRARELHIQDHKPAEPGGKTYQTATGIGPGTVDLIDKNSQPYRKVMRASWNDKLISTKDGPHDLLIFTGAATFFDYEHSQTLRADTLKVWLQPGGAAALAGPTASAQPAKAGSGQPAAAPQQKEGSPKPDHLEAIGNVVARSEGLNIDSAAQLVVWFKDVPADLKLPAAAVAVPGKQAGDAVGLTVGLAKPLPTGPTPAPGKSAGAGSAIMPQIGAAKAASPQAGPPKPAEPPRPMHLSAHSIEAWVLRGGDRNTLDKLWTEGDVRVTQAPAKPDERGVDIAGDTLQMNCHPEGNFLVVTGDLARLLMDKICIFGPEVNIDQAANKAWVIGSGAMQMESKTSFQGDQLSKPVPLDVRWQKSMLFDGNYAEFHESVQAEQENARLLCQRLEVHFDRPISLKEGVKGDQAPARVQHLVCDHNVNVVEETKVGDKVVKYQNLVAPGLNVRTLEPDEDTPLPPPAAAGSDGKAANAGNEVRASGPGVLRILQASADDPAGGPAPPRTTPVTPGATPPATPPDPGGAKPGPKPAEEMKLTWVSFDKSMYANTKKNKANFYENVRVLSFPCDNPKIEIDLDTMLEKLPPGGIFLRCEQMEVLSRPVKGGKAQQEMIAIGHVRVQSKDMSGRAAKVMYNEEKDQIILEGGDDGYAVLYKYETQGADQPHVRAKRITYMRKTGQYRTEGTIGINGTE